jgi:hypothetical protein
MGFEVTYKYYEKAEEGGYDMENIHDMTRKVGKAYDDTSYEKLAAAIFGQFARRDIMVTDVAITEFVKKQISFRETKNGICIKNKKYLFDGTAEIEFVEEAVPVQPQAPQYVPQQPPVPHSGVAPAPVQATGAVPDPFLGKKPLRHEAFEPDDVLAADARKRGLKFTRGNKYPIYEEKQDRRGILYGMIYVTKDDTGKKQMMSDRLFVFKQDLVGGRQFDDDSGPQLDYGPGLVGNTQSPIYGN